MKLRYILVLLAVNLSLFAALNAHAQTNASVPPVTKEANAATSQRSYIVPFQIHASGHLIVSLKINGHDAKLVIDTGAGATVIDQHVSDAFEIKIQDSKNTVQAVGAGGQQMGVRQSQNNRLQMGDWQTENMRLMVMDLSHVVEALKASGQEVQGVIGADFLIKNRAQIDYASKTLRFSPK